MDSESGAVTGNFEAEPHGIEAGIEIQYLTKQFKYNGKAKVNGMALLMSVKIVID